MKTELKTERLTLRPIRLGDEKAIHEYAGDKDITMMFYLNSITMSFFTDIMWIKVVISYGGVGLLYWTIAIIGYLFFDTVFNFWIPIMAFSVLGTFIYIHSLIKETKHAKKTHSIATKSAGDDSNGGQLQDTLSE